MHALLRLRLAAGGSDEATTVVASLAAAATSFLRRFALPFAISAAATHEPDG